MKTGLIALAALTMVACVANPGIVQISPDTFMLTREDKAGIFGNVTALKAKVISDANAFARSKGKVLIPVTTHETPMGILGHFATFEYQFRLVDSSDPLAKPTSLILRADVVVEKTEKSKIEVTTKGIKSDAHPDLYTELTKLDDLHKRGILTDAEFEQQKQKVLSQ